MKATAGVLRHRMDVMDKVAPVMTSYAKYVKGQWNSRGWAWTYLGVRVLHPGRVGGGGLVGVCLVVEEVKGLFTAAVVGAGGTLHHREPQLHVDLRRSLPLDEAAAQPVAGWAAGLTAEDLIDPHAVVLLVQAAYFVPLRGERRTKGRQVGSLNDIRPREPPNIRVSL